MSMQTPDIGLASVGPGDHAEPQPLELEDLPQLLDCCPGDRRVNQRVGRSMHVQVTGGTCSFRAITLNISCVGVLLGIVDRRFSSMEGLSLFEYLREVDTHFATGLHILFPAAVCEREARVVRVVERSYDTNRIMLIGCQFMEPLDPALGKVLVASRMPSVQQTDLGGYKPRSLRARRIF